MNKRIFFIAAAFLVFGLTIAAYAFNSASIYDTGTAGVACCKGDSCPMKKKDASVKNNASHSDDRACCKDGMCAMKKGDAAKAGHGDCCKMKKAHADAVSMKKMSDGESCPMMKEGGHKMAAGHEAKAGHSGCSCGCTCCGSKEKKADPTV